MRGRDIFFCERAPVWYRVNGTRAVRLLDVITGSYALRYTTAEGLGMMSVYRSIDGMIRAESERSIECDAHGNPTAVTGIQRYFPSAAMFPAQIGLTQMFNSTTGLWAWRSGDNYPEAPWPDARFQHDVNVRVIGSEAWLDECYYAWDGVNYVKAYDRGFYFEDHYGMWQLIHFTDNMGGETYVREVA